jgi:hypothetical protein
VVEEHGGKRKTDRLRNGDVLRVHKHKTADEHTHKHKTETETENCRWRRVGEEHGGKRKTEIL